MSLLAEVRGRGCGRALLQAAIDHARGAQVHKVELEVWPDNERAIALYERFGFEVEGIRRDHYRRQRRVAALSAAHGAAAARTDGLSRACPSAGRSGRRRRARRRARA